MPSITILDVPEDLHRALRVRAEQNGRSTEDEARDILERAVKPLLPRTGLGAELSALGRKIGLSNADVDAIQAGRNRTPSEPRDLG